MGMTWLDGTEQILIKGLNPDNETSGVYMRPCSHNFKICPPQEGQKTVLLQGPRSRTQHPDTLSLAEGRCPQRRHLEQQRGHWEEGKQNSGSRGTRQRGAGSGPSSKAERQW